MAFKFTPSTNIVRDSERELNYITTPNANRITEQLASDINTGIHAFNIIGTYGSGKSSYLAAFQQSVTGKKPYFDVDIFRGQEISCLNIVGEYKSLKDALVDQLDQETVYEKNEDIFKSITSKRSFGDAQVILIDEFGKFIEYACKNNPDQELYFIQEFVEFINHPKNNILLITAVHQNFDAYSTELSQKQRQDWNKVRGRFKEILFNEPIEQLLYIASELINSQFEKADEDDVKNLISLYRRTNPFDFNLEYITQIAEKLYPLDVFSSTALTICLQRYGQNERSLFYFLEANDSTALKLHIGSGNGFYGLSEVYDYLYHNFYSFINSKYNPDYSIWASIKNCLSRIETTFIDKIDEYQKIVKTIGILAITGKQGSKLDKDFLNKYSKISLGISDGISLVNELEKNKIIYFRTYSNRYVIFEGTDLDLHAALVDAEAKIDKAIDVSQKLISNVNVPYVIAKEVTYITGTPRMFEYVISEKVLTKEPSGEIDGYVNLLFEADLSTEQLLEKSRTVRDAIIYGQFHNSTEIKSMLLEIEKMKIIIEENSEDKYIARELKTNIEYHQDLLTKYVSESYKLPSSHISWIYNGKIYEVSSKRQFNQMLSKVCQEVYKSTPVFVNELVNKHKLSSSIYSAKKSYFRSLVKDWNSPLLGFPADKFPPEKTIYLALKLRSGIDKALIDGRNWRDLPEKSSFDAVWEASDLFLERSKVTKQNVSALFDTLAHSPFKLKQGLIDFWIPTYLFTRRDDFALFSRGTYIPYLTDDSLELISKYPKDFEIKAFDINGIKLDLFNKYRNIINQQERDKVTTTLFIETIRPFLTFYRELPEYSKLTKRLTKQAIAVRTAISLSTDPERTFFEDLPRALGFTLDGIQSSTNELNGFIDSLQESIKELRTSYDSLIQRFEQFIEKDINSISGSSTSYKQALQSRFSNLNRSLLVNHQQIFIQRLYSSLEDRTAWLSSLAQTLVGKQLSKFSDHDELTLYNKFKDIVHSLDSLTTISSSDIDQENEVVYDLQINSFLDGNNKKLIRFPKSKQSEVELTTETLRQTLGSDKTVNIAALTLLLKQLME
ncbi:hypothetical protein LZD49_34325 [Dyadobacter sp. CY261]|uniref:hypothetical protein n=1 Tax=Dyadobacter sp. CY261 TaxID=2907203 RepID=UPI001F368B4E|nr:hypothetical protein [Dyadobacter sp. CY261]MCF0075600.1 hypothetical protein [Dyadobacter sp. CY261]